MTERPLSRRELSAELFPSAVDPLGALRWCLAGLRRALGSAEAFAGDPVVPALSGDVLSTSTSWAPAGSTSIARPSYWLASILDVPRSSTPG